MALSSDALQMLMLLERPAFFAEGPLIIEVNTSAAKLRICPGITLTECLSALPEIAEQPVMLGGFPYSLQCTHMGNYQLYILSQQEGREALEVLNLAACNLRMPLFTMLNAMEMILDGDESFRGSLYKNYYQVQRTICNMSDAARYAYRRTPKPILTEAKSFMEELIRKITQTLQSLDLTIHYSGLEVPLFCMLEQEMLERAVHNLISNAVKAGSQHIEIRFSRRGSMLHFSVYDDGHGIPPEIRSDTYQRFLRSPGLSTSQYGLGLGMVMIRAAATAHQGTVLAEQNPDMGLHVTITLTIVSQNETTLKQPTLRVDYLGGLDHTLVELSDVLPAKEFEDF